MIEKTMAVIEADPEIALCYPKTKLVNLVEGTENKYDDKLHLIQDNPIERFLGVMENISLCNIHLRISRTAMLHKTLMLRPFPRADLNLVVEMAIYGKFFEVHFRCRNICFVVVFTKTLQTGPAATRTTKIGVFIRRKPRMRSSIDGAPIWKVFGQ